jgi:hypothetical protein
MGVWEKRCTDAQREEARTKDYIRGSRLWREKR